MKSASFTTDKSLMIPIQPLPNQLEIKFLKLQDLFQEMGSVVVALSGGIDSTLVLKVAHDILGDHAVAITAVSPTLPATELESVKRITQELGVQLILKETNQLAIPNFVQNDESRCYHCKTDLYQLLDHTKKDLGLSAMVDGTNFDDLGDDRPGMKAAQDYGVRSPLVEVQMGKDDIRALAQRLELSNWKKPAAACLSSRIPRGIPITRENLSRVERAESVLIQEGFTQIRVRDHQGMARIEIQQDELPLFLDGDRRHRIITNLKAAGFRLITLDLEGYRQGGGN